MITTQPQGRGTNRINKMQYHVAYQFNSARDGTVSGRFLSDVPLDLADDDTACFRAIETHSQSVIHTLEELECHSVYEHGEMVFWGDLQHPHWVVQWQPENGNGSYWIVDAGGNSGVASPEELRTIPL